MVLRDTVAGVHRQGAATERERTHAVGGEGRRDCGEGGAERDARRASERVGSEDRREGRLAQGDANAIGDCRDDRADVDARAGDRHADEECRRATRIIQDGAHRDLIDRRREGRGDRCQCCHRGAIRDAVTADELADSQSAEAGESDAGLADDAAGGGRVHWHAEGGQVAGRNTDEGLADGHARGTSDGRGHEDRGGGFLIQGDTDARRDRRDDRASGDAGTADWHADEEFRRGTRVIQEGADAELVGSGHEGRDDRRDTSNDGARDDARAADDLAGDQARDRGHSNLGTTDRTARRADAGGRAGQDVGSVRGATEVEEQRAFVEHGTTEMRLEAAEDERTFALLGQRTQPLEQRRSLYGNRATGIDLDGRGVGQVDVQTTRGGRVDAGEGEIGRGVKVTEHAAREVEVTDGASVGEVDGATDDADEEFTRIEGVGCAAVSAEAGSQGAAKHKRADAGRAAVLREGTDIRSRGERARGFGRREADDGSVEQTAVKGERTRADRAGRSTREVATNLHHRSAHVELGTGEVDVRGAGLTTRREVVDEEGRCTLVAAVLTTEHEDWVDDASLDGDGRTCRVLPELESFGIQ